MNPVRFTVTNVYTLKILSVERYSDNALSVRFKLEYPAGVRNSKRVLKSVIKTSSEFRNFIVEAVKEHMQSNRYNHVSYFNSYSRASTLGNDCSISIFFGKDAPFKELDNNFLDDLIYNVSTN